MNRLSDTPALGDVPAYEMHPDDAMLLAELCDLDESSGLETKSVARPGVRRPGQGDLQKDAIVEIGKAVLEQGKKIDAIAARVGDTKRATAATQHTWKTFQEINDRRLAAQRKTGRSDPLDDQQLDRINKALDTLGDVNRRLSQIEVKRNRPPAMGTRMNAIGAGSPGMKKLAVERFRKAVHNYIRTGEESFEGESLKALQTKAMHSELNPQGGYVVLPERADSPLSTFLLELSPMRQRATVRSISAAEFQQPTEDGNGAEAGWVGERDARPETDTPTLGLDKFPTMELYAKPKATQMLLDDAAIDVEAWLAGKVGEGFALKESDAWFNGNGVIQPRGLLTYPFVADASWAHGKFRYIATGSSGAFPASTPDNKLIDITYTLKAGHRNNATWMCSRSTVGVIRKFKDANNLPLWQPSTQAGQPATLIGFPVDEDEFMPDIGADTTSLGFGDWKKTYLIVDRIGVRVLRDPYSAKPWVEFYTTKRVGGGVQYFDAAVFLKFGTS